MGKEIYENFKEVTELYKEASNSIGYDIAQLSFEGPKNELDKTVRTQPALLTAGYSTFKVLTLKGINPFCVAGHSLGEYTAVVSSGFISFKEAVKLTEKRGQYMQEAVPEGKGMMAAIIGLERNKVNEICNAATSGYVAPANYNCPGQIVIAGEKQAVEDAMKRADEAGAKRTLPLAVSVPSHCKLMEPASKKLSTLLDSMDFHPARVPVVNNADAQFIDKPERIKESLIRQLSSPLLWEDSVKYMVGNRKPSSQGLSSG
jgi:[acyl-carrier-protein] S-malonyltransferase